MSKRITDQCSNNVGWADANQLMHFGTNKDNTPDDRFQYRDINCSNLYDQKNGFRLFWGRVIIYCFYMNSLQLY